MMYDRYRVSRRSHASVLNCRLDLGPPLSFVTCFNIFSRMTEQRDSVPPGFWARICCLCISYVCRLMYVSACMSMRLYRKIASALPVHAVTVSSVNAVIHPRPTIGRLPCLARSTLLAPATPSIFQPPQVRNRATLYYIHADVCFYVLTSFRRCCWLKARFTASTALPRSTRRVVWNAGSAHHHNEILY